MTCEIVVANRLGLALAADSAVTFSGQNGNTYSSGANKIFQLATSAPVAVMIYNGASLHGMPWEVIIKAFRRSLGNRTCETLAEYRDALTQYLNTEALSLLPQELRKTASKHAYEVAAGTLFGAMLESQPILKEETPAPDPGGIATAVELAFSEIEATLQALPVLPGLLDVDLQSSLDNIGESLAKMIDDHLKTQRPSLYGLLDTRRLAKCAIETAFKMGDQVLLDGYTGLVLAGYGEQDYLPGFLALHCHGFIGTRILFKPEGQGDINLGVTASLIHGFAQRAMIETFTQGASPEVWKSVGSAFRIHAANACRSIVDSIGGVATDEQIADAVASVANEFNKQWAYSTFDAHLKPLREIVAGLTLDGLTELAETLVMLESLKEKVTSRTQSVGGPIDVAVLTKEDGLIWIKRKHYFDPALNQRYINRLKQR